MCGYKKMINFVGENAEETTIGFRGILQNWFPIDSKTGLKQITDSNGNFDERKEDKDRHYIACRHLDGDADVVP